MRLKFFAVFIVLLASAAPALAQQKTLKIYNWSDYINPDVIAAFEKETGTKIIYDTYDSVELVETKLMAGRSGYDLVVVGATATLPRHIPLGLYLKLDKTKLPNLKHVWPVINERLQPFDPGNQYSVNYMWGTTGIGYNVVKAKERLGGGIDSWKTVFDPGQIKKFADCGFYMLDATEEAFPAALTYLGLDPDTRSLDDLKKAADALYAIRPYVTKYHSSEYINALANGDICLAVGYSGDILQAKARAEEATGSTSKVAVKIAYSMPKEGAEMWFDNFVIPRDAENPEAAYAFIDFINRPEMAAKNSAFIRYASGNLSAQRFLDASILSDPGIYPDDATLKRLYTTMPYDQKTQNAVNRMWTNIKANRKPY